MLTMANMVTRTIKTCKATAYELDFKDGNPVAVSLGEVYYDAINDNEGEARKQLKNAGVKVPRGAKVQVEVIDETVYGLSVDMFMSLAQVVER